MSSVFPPAGACADEVAAGMTARVRARSGETILRIRDTPPSLCPHEVDVRLGRLIRRRHISPVLGVMIGIDDSEYRLVHVSVPCAAGDVEKGEFHGLAVWR